MRLKLSCRGNKCKSLADDTKNIEREIIHGRFAQLAVAGAW